MADWDSDPWAEEEPANPPGKQSSAVVLAFAYLALSVAFIVVYWALWWFSDDGFLSDSGSEGPTWMIFAPLPIGVFALALGFSSKPLRMTLIAIGVGVAFQLISVLMVI